MKRGGNGEPVEGSWDGTMLSGHVIMQVEDAVALEMVFDTVARGLWVG